MCVDQATLPFSVPLAFTEGETIAPPLKRVMNYPFQFVFQVAGGVDKRWMRMNLLERERERNRRREISSSDKI